MRRTTVSVLAMVILAAAPLRTFAGPGVGTIWDRDVPAKDRATIAAFYGGVILAIGGAWALDRLLGEKGGDKDETPEATMLTLTAEGLDSAESAAELLERDGVDLPKDLNDKQIKALRRLPGLKRLFLDKTSISADGLSVLAELKELEVLALPPTANVAVLKQIVAFKSLKEINLSGAKLIDDDGLETLGKFSALKRVGIGGTSITKEGQAKLQALLPMAEIQR